LTPVVTPERLGSRDKLQHHQRHKSDTRSEGLCPATFSLPMVLPCLNPLKSTDSGSVPASNSAGLAMTIKSVRWG